MAVAFYLELTDVTGECKVSGYEEQIDVMAWSWGMSQPVSAHAAGGAGGPGKVSVQSLNISKYVDKASPTLMQFCANGKHIEKGVLTACKMGGEDDAVVFYTITMDEVFVSNVSAGGSEGSDGLTEQVALDFAKVHVKYYPQEETGAKGQDISFDWDIKANKSC
ncbi:MAG: type VI secretion system tube protein Hcp [Deltaproteobacteria bacterium]|jgi:type VI secretion system secreted protein Hcp|nr:type VI secretion system tube protein Hcp [Deltaproteobacteria bacterium]